jgi:hypothetical protein
MQGQVLDNEASIFGTCIAGRECIIAKEPAVEHERIDLSWKQFEGKKKYLYWNFVDTRPDVAGDCERTPEHVQQEHDAKDSEARRRGFARP